MSDPLVFVPGITGSEINAPPSVFAPFGATLWCSPPALLFGGMQRMALPVAGEPDPPGLAPCLPGLPLAAYYGSLLWQLSGFGYSITCPLLDWRFGAAVDAPAVAGSIAAAGANAPAVVLCHSRGGLVVRRALSILAGAGQLSRVKRVVAVGTPHQGSLQAVAALACWNVAKGRVESLAKFLPNFLEQNFNPFVVRRTMRSWPGLYELLPAPGNGYLAPAVTDALYDPATYAGSPLRVVPQYLADARAAWSSLPAIPPGVEWVSFVGRGVPTPTGLDDPSAVADPGAFARSLEGDGVVPAVSAYPGVGFRYFIPDEHTSCVWDGRFPPRLLDVLRNGLPEDQTMPGDVFNLQ